MTQFEVLIVGFLNLLSQKAALLLPVGVMLFNKKIKKKKHPDYLPEESMKIPFLDSLRL